MILQPILHTSTEEAREARKQSNGLEEWSSVYFRYWSSFLTMQGQSLAKSATIERSLESGCGLSHKSAQDSYNGTCVCEKLAASKPTW